MEAFQTMRQASRGYSSNLFLFLSNTWDVSIYKSHFIDKVQMSTHSLFNTCFITQPKTWVESTHKNQLMETNQICIQYLLKVRKMAKIRNQFNQAPHLTYDTNGEVTTSQLHITNESQEVSPLPAGDYKALINRRARKHNKVSKGAKIRNRYNQVPHLTKDTNGKVTNPQLDTTNKSQDVTPFPADDHKAHLNRRAQRQSKHKTVKHINYPQKKYRLGTVSKIFHWRA